MKLLHTSDWHLGMARPGGASYEDDQRHAILQIYEIIRDEEIDGILLAGDVFDKSIASQDAVRFYDEIMTHICGELGIPVFLIAGNHDGAERISQCSDLLKKSGLFIAGALEKEPAVIRGKELETDSEIDNDIHASQGKDAGSTGENDVDIYMLPWISTDKVRSIYPETEDDINSLEDAYRIVLDRYRDHFIDGHRNILIAHAYVRGAETSTSDRAAEIGGAAMLSSDIFEGFDYVALGHLHGPQWVRDSKGNDDRIRYSGSIMAFSFGKEEKQEKSVTVIDTDDMSIRIIPLHQIHRRKTLKGTFDELMDGDFDEDVMNGYLRLEITDSFVGMDSLARFREKYPCLLEIIGKSFEKEDSMITMTVEELDQAETDPETVFARYCRDIMGEDPDDHQKELFANALKRYGREVTEE